MAGNVKVGGNVIATHTGVEGAGTVTLSNVTASGIKMSSSGNTITDSAGNAVLSESSGVVTLAHDIIDGNSSYGFAQLKLTSNKTFSTSIVWDTITGDTSNFTKPSNNHLIRLGISGIYLINGNLTARDTNNERAVYLSLKKADNTLLANTSDSIYYMEGNDTYAGCSLSYVEYFPANTDIYFSVESFQNDTKEISSETHASIVLLRKTS
tara:strand:- start:794 stop:1423 length:630 start_codon:yes stop_codon:yes gene_type:complete